MTARDLSCRGLRPIEDVDAETPNELADPTPPPFADEALALRFAERHADDLRYVAARSKWMAWDGVKWRRDDTLAAFDMARRICREAATECNKPKYRDGAPRPLRPWSASPAPIGRLAATIDQWDA